MVRRVVERDDRDAGGQREIDGQLRCGARAPDEVAGFGEHGLRRHAPRDELGPLYQTGVAPLVAGIQGRDQRPGIEQYVPARDGYLRQLWARIWAAIGSRLSAVRSSAIEPTSGATRSHAEPGAWFGSVR